MKRILIIASVLFFAFVAKSNAGQTITIVNNNSSCSANIFFWAHDGGLYSTPGTLNTVASGDVLIVAASSSYGPVDISAFDCACSPYWVGGPFGVTVAGSGWDAVKVNPGPCHGMLLSDSGYMGAGTSTSYPNTCCGGGTVVWTVDQAGNITVTIN